MSMLTDIKYRLRALFNRSAVDRELDDELRFHLERETEKYVRAGMTRTDAERKARVEFGGIERIKDDTRDARGLSLVDSVGQDLRYAWRGLRAKPGFTFAVVATLGLGIGANTAMFGIIDRMLFRPPAYLADADRVHRVFTSWTSRGSERFERHHSYLRYLELTKNAQSFDRAAAFGDRRLAIGTGANATEKSVAAVSGTFFGFFDARPAAGRFFRPDEDSLPGGALSAVLAYDFWQSEYAGSPSVVGQSLHVDSQIFTIVGVAPQHFFGITDFRPALFIPITTFAHHRNRRYYETHNWTWIEVLVRRKPGVSAEAANAELSVAYARSWDVQREGQGGSGLSADSARTRALLASTLLGRSPHATRDADVIRWVMGVAVIVLLVACANVANLLLARAVTRRREVAMRLALGVTRGRLFQQVLTESVLIAGLGGIAGVTIAQWGSRALRALFLQEQDAVASDVRTLLFATLATLGVALLTGLAPAMHAVRGDVAAALKGGERDGGQRSRLRTGLLVFQAALSVVLLVGASLYVRSLGNVRSLRLGYDVESVALLEGKARGTRLTDAQYNELADRLVARAASLPGVRSAALTVAVPFYSFEGRGAPFVPGVDSVGKLGRFNLQAGSISYFETLGTRILKGRGFTDGDRAGAPVVAVVSESMARALWQQDDAIGKRFRIDSDTSPFITVVGVAEDMRAARLTGTTGEFWYYLPIEQFQQHYGPKYLQVFVRVDGPVDNYLETLRREVGAEMPGDGYINVTPMRRFVSGQQRSWEFGAKMFAAFGALALTLAALGLYSVIAYGVAQRTRELGVRIALGAGVRDVIRMIVGQGVAFALAGIMIGSAIALYAARWVEPMLYSQSPRDPVIYAGVAVVLLVVAVIATLRPALRATRVDPTLALRSD